MQLIFFVDRKVNSIIEQQKCVDHEKRHCLLISKVDFSFKISQRNKNFTYWSNVLKLSLFYESLNFSKKLFLKLIEEL